MVAGLDTTVRKLLNMGGHQTDNEDKLYADIINLLQLVDLIRFWTVVGAAGAS